MKLCAVTCTYNRPQWLPRVIRCFEEQDYGNAHMVIYDDGGQYQNQSGKNWTLVSRCEREPSLGAKRNKSIALAVDIHPDLDAVLPIDDDDLFLPWHFSSAAAALANAEWSRPSQILTGTRVADQAIFQASYTGHRRDQRTNRLYHPAWAMRIGLVERAGGYPPHLSGPEDQGLMRAMEDLGATEADPIELGFAPSYIYCWGTNNISGKLSILDRNGVSAWAALGGTLAPATLDAWDPFFDLHHPVIAPGVKERRF